MKRRVEKDGDNPFASALTDADLSVQNCIEVELLTHFPEVSFFGEEKDSSINAKYFPPGAPITVFLDPIDGTLCYKNGFDNFNIILSVAGRKTFEAAIIFMPGKGQFVIAERGKGISIGQIRDISRPANWKKLKIQAGGPLIHFADDVALAKVGAVVPVVGIAESYKSHPPGISPNLMLLGEPLGGLFTRNGSVIDWGVWAFLLELSGWVVTDEFGQSLPPPASTDDFRYPSLLALPDKEAHASVVMRLVHK